jgi:hypothetical protein
MKLDPVENAPLLAPLLNIPLPQERAPTRLARVYDESRSSDSTHSLPEQHSMSIRWSRNFDLQGGCWRGGQPGETVLQMS